MCVWEKVSCCILINKGYKRTWFTFISQSRRWGFKRGQYSLTALWVKCRRINCWIEKYYYLFVLAQHLQCLKKMIACIHAYIRWIPYSFNLIFLWRTRKSSKIFIYLYLLLIGIKSAWTIWTYISEEYNLVCFNKNKRHNLHCLHVSKQGTMHCTVATLGMQGTEFVVKIVVYLTNRLGVNERMKFVDFAFDVLIFGVDGFEHDS